MDEILRHLDESDQSETPQAKAWRVIATRKTILIGTAPLDTAVTSMERSLTWVFAAKTTSQALANKQRQLQDLGCGELVPLTILTTTSDLTRQSDRVVRELCNISKLLSPLFSRAIQDPKIRKTVRSVDYVSEKLTQFKLEFDRCCRAAGGVPGTVPPASGPGGPTDELPGSPTSTTSGNPPPPTPGLGGPADQAVIQLPVRFTYQNFTTASLKAKVLAGCNRLQELMESAPLYDDRMTPSFRLVEYGEEQGAADFVAVFDFAVKPDIIPQNEIDTVKTTLQAKYIEMRPVTQVLMHLTLKTAESLFPV